MDLGCGSGSYTFPAARLVGEDGLVVAVDKQKRVLEHLKRSARTEGLRNIRTASDLDEAKACLKGRRCQAVLLYDVLHFMERSERVRLYAALHELLDSGGVLSVHPKHVNGRQAARHLRELTMGELAREVESRCFRLTERKTTKLWHHQGREDSILLNFKQA